MQVDAPAVEVNALRATLGVQPLPYPLAGAVSGHMQCYGALQEPVFSGRVDAVPSIAHDGAVALHNAPQSDASEALRQARDAGEAAALTYDKVAIQCAAAFRAWWRLPERLRASVKARACRRRLRRAVTCPCS